MMNTKNKTFLKNHRGQSLVELGLFLPVLLLFIFGTLDLGRLFYTKIVLTNAAREGANYLAYFPEDSENTYSAILDEADSSNVQIDASNVSILNCCTYGDPVEVKITMDVNLFFSPLITLITGGDGKITITSSVEMVVQ
jgi:Flp pilus assembly protein TadG